MAKDNYQLLIQKLDSFIRKYYLNNLIKGLLYTTALLVVLFLGFSLLENYFYFSSTTRKGMFWTFLLTSGVALGGWVIAPLLQYFKLGSVITHEQAASIIGDHFGGVKDKLLNVLQLRDQAASQENEDLIMASINQKSEEIKLVPFKSAINLGENKKYLKYALPPLMLLLGILFINSSLITDPTNRLLKNNQEFERPAPFAFEIENKDMQVVQFDDFPLTVKVDGDALPNDVFIDFDNVQYRLKKESANTFTYNFSNVQKDMEFNLFSGTVRSGDYELEVLKKPNINGFEVKLDYPNYIGRSNETLQSIGDLVIPQGTNISWIFSTQNTDEIAMQFGESQSKAIERRSDDMFLFGKKALKDERYKLFISNERLLNADSIAYTLSVIQDQSPVIKAEMFQDSTEKRLQYFAGEAGDDYGLSKLTFNYRLTKERAAQGALETVPISIKGEKSTQFDYTFDMLELGLKPGDEVTYFFEVWDNDGVNGAKSARTNMMQFSMPTLDELEELEEENDDQIKEDLLKALKESKKIKKDMKKMREKLLQEKEMKWQDKKELEKLLDRQKEMQKMIEEAKQKFEENLQNQEEFNKQDERIQEKQEKLEELFEKAMDPETQKLMEEIQEMMEKLEKEDALEKMEEMEMNDEELEMELDRMLEMFKEMELEMEMEKAIEDLEKLAEKQEELAEKTEEQKESQEELKKEQEEINEEFEEIQEQLDEIEKKNEELENKQELEDTEKDEEEIKEEMEKSQEQLEQKQNKKASKSQKKAGEKMKEMAQKMQQQMKSQEMEQMEEDMQALRQLLENLVTLSFDQEQLIDDFGTTKINTPRYVDLTQQQFKLKDDFKLIEDTLHALSKRVHQIESFVTEKVVEVKTNMEQGIDDLEERRKPNAAEHQQRVMKNVNDLALMLSETMEQMQQQMSGNMPGDQQCNNPGGKSGNKPSDKISKGQKSLKEQLEQMKKGMQKGNQPGSKGFAKMAAKQAAMREALRKKQQELQQRGKGDPKLQEIIDEMNKVEIDLVNKRLTNEMMKRQEEILSNLLKHEKAEREKDQDKKRKGKTAQNYERKRPPSMEEYLKKREAEIDLYKTVSPSLRPYYRKLVEQYHRSLKSK